MLTQLQGSLGQTSSKPFGAARREEPARLQEPLECQDVRRRPRAQPTILFHNGNKPESGLESKPELKQERKQIMKSYKTYSDSAYLKKEDFPEPETLTIDEVCEEEVTAPGRKPKLKLVLSFEGIDKGLVLNQANGDALFEMTGQDDPAKWVGRRVEVYHDPNVTYAGKRVGGIRLRKPAAVSAKETVPF
jgi:hypothetical protein